MRSELLTHKHEDDSQPRCMFCLSRSTTSSHTKEHIATLRVKHIPPRVRGTNTAPLDFFADYMTEIPSFEILRTRLRELEAREEDLRQLVAKFDDKPLDEASLKAIDSAFGLVKEACEKVYAAANEVTTQKNELDEKKLVRNLAIYMRVNLFPSLPKYPVIRF